MLLQRLLPNYGYCLVWRKIMTIVFENKKIESRNQTVGSVSGSYIDLTVFERGRKQAEIHNARRRGEMEAIGRGQAFVSVRPLHKLITKSSPPLRSIHGCLRQRCETQTAGIVTANFQRKGVIEAERRPKRKTETSFIFLFDALVNVSLIAPHLLLE